MHSINQQIHNALNFRHACKIFDENKKIKDEDFDTIIQSAIMAPSSMGLEPTRIEVIDSASLRAALRPLCWDQVQITSASKVVVLKNIIDDIDILSHDSTKYMENMSLRRGKTQEQRDKWLQIVRQFLKNKKSNDELVGNWSAKQGYITAGFMMLSASMLGIDSCAIEGFEQQKVEELLGINYQKERLNLILCFGYRIKEQQARYRLSKDELVTIR